MLVAAIFSFVAGIYLGVLYSVPLKYILIPLTLLLFIIPFFIGKVRFLSAILIIVCFALSGMVRIAMVAGDQPVPITDTGKDIYEGTVIESSPNTKIVKLILPGKYASLKVMVRTPEPFEINDRLKVFGEVREIYPTFKNPHTLSWKWLKKLEGVSYELRGTVVSVAPGTHYVHAVRNVLKQKIDMSGAQHAGIIKALTIGDTTGLDEEIKKLFLYTGTSHILAISGSNIGIVTAFVFYIIRFLVGRRRIFRLRGDDTRYAAIVTIPFALAFMLVAGSSIPTVRATIMITIFMLALFFERGRDIFNTIALSALTILIIYPHSLFTPSFQLTFTSVIFIILFSQNIFSLLKTDNRFLKWLLLSVGMTIAATLGTLPVVLYHFFGINFFSVLHNLIAVPLMCVVAMPLSLFGVVLPFGDYLLRISGEVLAFTIHILKALNWGYIYPLIRPNLFEVILYFTLLIAFFNFNRKLVVTLVIFLFVPVATTYGCYLYNKRFNNDLRVNFVDVGNGDAIIVEGPKGIRMLIDGGGFHAGDFDVGKSVLTPILLSKKIMTIDHMISTHPHGDHLGGIPTIINDFTVKAFATGSYFISTEKFVDIMKLLKKKKIPLTTWKRGDRILLGKDVEISILNPGPETGIDNLNNASLAMIMRYHNFSILFAGDIGAEIEEKLILAGTNLKADVIKIPHHGSKHSSSHEFLASVQPKVAVLSVGRGISGIPSHEAIKRYEEFAIPILRTDNSGMIQVWNNKGKIFSSTYGK